MRASVWVRWSEVKDKQNPEQVRINKSTFKDLKSVSPSPFGADN